MRCFWDAIDHWNVLKEQPTVGLSSFSVPFTFTQRHNYNEEGESVDPGSRRKQSKHTKRRFKDKIRVN